MARATRSKPAAATGKDDTTKSSPISASKYTLEEQSGSIPGVFILPSKATPSSRIVTLPHPRHGKPARYLVCPETGVYEFTKITAPKTTPRSWLLESRTETGEGTSNVKASVTDGADMFLATSTDPMFLVLPALVDSKAARGPDDQKKLFLSSDDYFDKLPEEYSHLSEILRTPATRSLFEERMGEICDTVDAGDELMFRLSEEKLVNAVLKKARRMCEGGLPQSMEEKFVRKALEAPILMQRRVAPPTGDSQSLDGPADSGVSTPVTESNESQATDASGAAASQVSTAATSVVDEAGTVDEVGPSISASVETQELQRLRVAFNFICSSYIAPTTASLLQSLLTTSSNTTVSFTPLDTYLAEITKLRAEAVAARSQSDYSRKRARDDEEDEARAEKKRKAEEEKKKKANESHGVRQLKKVNTSGMKKLSAFFQKK